MEVKQMAAYLASKIMAACDAGGLEAGQAKYRAAFVVTSLYLRYKADTDSILTLEGYGACIVTE